VQDTPFADVDEGVSCTLDRQRWCTDRRVLCQPSWCLPATVIDGGTPLGITVPPRGVVRDST
jgi:hypothetical protein